MSSNITYSTTITPNEQQIISLYESSGIRRPTQDAPRIKKMYDNSNLVVTAWDGDLLVGVSRCMTDFCYACYLSDLAIRDEYKQQGIGKTLVAKTKEAVGLQTTIILVAAPAALNYYAKIGMKRIDYAYLLPREE